MIINLPLGVRRCSCRRKWLAGGDEVEVGLGRVQAVGGQGDHRVGVAQVPTMAPQVSIVLEVPGVYIVPGSGAGRVPAAAGRGARAVHGAQTARGWYPVGGGRHRGHSSRINRTMITDK